MYEALKAKNATRFANVKLTRSFTSTVKKMLANKARYQAVEAKTGVPWPVIAAIHVREADMSFNTQLAQGDPLSRVSTHVPRGQGPYFGADAWERAAMQALSDTGGKTWGDWSAGGWTTFLEKYNGLGYANKGRPSPYVWAGTNQYTSGKYVADGQYSSTAVDTQPGCANLIIALAQLDTSIWPSDLTPGKTMGPKATVGTVAATGGIVAAVVQPHLWPWILGGVAAIILVLIIVHFLEKSSK
jgi:lysozyme family protein